MENEPLKTDHTFLCSTCGVTKGTQELLEEHILEHHKEFNCAHCDLSFDQETEVLKHIESCSEEQRLKEFKLTNPLAQEEIIDEQLYKCKYCSWSFEDVSSLKKHGKLRHTNPPKIDDGKVPCPLCIAHFPSKSKLGRHYNGVHLKLRPYECRDCRIKFSQRATLNKHLKDHHKKGEIIEALSESLPIMMPDSSDQESSEAVGEDNLLSAEPEVNLNVSPSKLRVPLKMKLKLHSSPSSVGREERRLNGIHNDLSMSPNNKCYLCLKNFSQRSSLNRHLRGVHSVDTNQLKYQGTPSRPSLHISSPKGSHRCFICDISFSRLSDLENHNADLHSKHIRGHEIVANQDQAVLIGSVGAHDSVPEAVCTEVIGHEGNSSNIVLEPTREEMMIYQRQSEAALALRKRTDISTETASVAASLLSLPESVVPFSSISKDDVFNMRTDEEDEPIGADLKQRINELSMALEANDVEPMASSSTYVGNNDLHIISRSNKRSIGAVEIETPRKKARRETLPPSVKSDESLIPKFRSKRSSLPSYVMPQDQTRKHNKSKDFLYYSDGETSENQYLGSKPDDFVEGTFRCMECYTFFYCKKEFESHMDAKHREIRPFKCSKCHASFKSDKALDIHNAAVHEKLKPHVCPKCGTGFGQKASLYRHIKEVNHEKVYCSDCNACFNVKRDLAEHINSIHTGLKPFKCDSCDRCFVSKHQRHIHTLTVHEKRRPFKCEQCGAAFGQRGSLHRHMKTVDHKFLPHKCSLCLRGFRKEEDLKNHTHADHISNVNMDSEALPSGSQQRLFKCSMCSHSFKSQQHLDHHESEYHNTEEQFCSICDLSFENSDDLDVHMKRNHATNMHHQCINCKTVFKKKKQLKKHIDSVRENSTHHCDRCNILFCLSKDLSSHMVTIHGEREPLKEEVESNLPCSSNLFESLDYAAALGVKQNLEQFVDNIKKKSPKKSKMEVQKSVLNSNKSTVVPQVPGSSNTIAASHNLTNSPIARVNHFIKQETEFVDESLFQSSNNNTYEKYIEASPSNNQYMASNSPEVAHHSSSELTAQKLLLTKLRYEQQHSIISKQPRTVEYQRNVESNGMQYSTGVSPISYGDTSSPHRENYGGTVHFSKAYANPPSNKPINATNKGFIDNSLPVGPCSNNDSIHHPKLTKTYVDQDGQQHLIFERKPHYERDQYVLASSEGPIDVASSKEMEKVCVNANFVNHLPVHSNGGALVKTYVTEHDRNTISSNAGYVQALHHSNKPIDASTKIFSSVTVSDYMNTDSDNSIKYIDSLPKDGSIRNFVVTEEGNYIHSDQLKFVEPMDLNGKNFHHINDLNREIVPVKFAASSVDKPLDATSKTYISSADYQDNQSLKYVEAAHGNGGATASVASEQAIKYAEKVDGNKVYNEYPFEDHEIGDAVTFVEGKGRGEEYFIPVTAIGQMQYVVKPTEDQTYENDTLSYAVSMNGSKTPVGTKVANSSLDTLYAVAVVEEVNKPLEVCDERGGGTQEETSQVTSPSAQTKQQSFAVLLDDEKEDKTSDEEEGGKNNYALTLHLVESLEKHVHKGGTTLGDVDQYPVNLESTKNYDSSAHSPQMALAVGPSIDEKERSSPFEGQVQYMTTQSNGDVVITTTNSVSVSKTNMLDGNNVIIVKDQQAIKGKLTPDNSIVARINNDQTIKLNKYSNDLAVVASSSADQVFDHPYLCWECNDVFPSRETLNAHVQTHQS